jgi:hypothetical protein
MIRCLAVVALVGATVHAADPGHPFPGDRRAVFPCPRLPASPILDGQRDTVYDRDGFTFRGFMTIGERQLASENSRTTLGWDDHALYVFIECPLTDGRRPLSAAPQRDGNLWEGEDVELFLDPGPTRQRYFQLAADPLGNRFDRRTDQADWSSEQWQVACATTARDWTAEIRIPWTMLEMGKPQAGAELGFNVGRTHRSVLKVPMIATLPLVQIGSSAFHDVNGYALLRLTTEREAQGLTVDFSPLIHAVSVKPRQVTVRGGGGATRAAVQATTPSGTELACGGATLPTGQSTAVPFTLPLDAAEIRLELVSADGGPLVRSPAYPTGLAPVAELRRQLAQLLTNGQELAASGKQAVAADAAALQALTLSSQEAQKQTVTANANVPADGGAALATTLREKVIQAAPTVARLAAVAQGHPGTALAVENAMRKIRPGDLPTWAVAPAIHLAAARGEHETAQLLLERLEGESPLTIQAVTSANLRPEKTTLPANGATIPAPEVRWVENVLVDMAAGNWRTRFYEQKREWPEILRPPPFPAVSGGQRLALWLTWRVPTATPAGDYAGTVEIALSGTKKPVSIPVRLRVHDFTLAPEKRNLQTSIWLGSHDLTRWYGGDLSWEEFQPWLDLLADYRLTPAMGAVIEGAYNLKGGGIKLFMDQSTSVLSADFSIMDQYADFHVRRGLGPIILTGSCHSAWLFAELPLFDRKTGERLKRPADNRGAADRLAEQFCRLAYDHYRKRGQDKLFVMYPADEPSDHKLVQPLKDFVAACRRGWPGLPMISAGTAPDTHPELVGVIDRWCPLTDRYQRELAATRRTHGDQVWWYSTWAPLLPSPNILLAQPGLDHRMLFWQAFQNQVDGYLFWGTVVWPATFPHWYPETRPDDPQYGQAPPLGWPTTRWNDRGANGDGYLVYPGPAKQPWPGVRLSLMRDGVEDWEYLTILNRRLAAAANATGKVAPAVLAAAKKALDLSDVSRSLSDYERDPAKLEEKRAAIAAAIVQLPPAADEIK